MKLNQYTDVTAHPEASKVGLEQAIDVFPMIQSNSTVLQGLSHVFAISEFLKSWLNSRPDELKWINSVDNIFAHRTAKEIKANLGSLMENQNISIALRRFKHRELLCICAREISGIASLEETMGSWSAVADTAISAAVDYSVSQATKKYGQPIYKDRVSNEKEIAQFAVLAMGKLGGRELNISSDIDVIYAHSSDNGTTNGGNSISLHEFFVIIARNVTKLLNDVTDEGFVFRVDLGLRPEGRAGEITNSIGALETYYESWGQQWERQALIKARFCGGSTEVVDDLITRIKPFIYKKYIDKGALSEIAAMKDKIDESFAQKPSEGGINNIKLGHGGIREIEFVTQALQLLYGARHKELRTTSTLNALSAFDSLGLLSKPHNRDLKEAYLTYRKLENRIQYFMNQQTHQLPKDKKRRRTLAKSLGFAGVTPEKSMGQKIKTLKARVRNIFDMFFSKKDEKVSEKFPVDLDDEKSTSEWLDSLLFDHPEVSAKALKLLRAGGEPFHPSEKIKKRFGNFGPFLVSEAMLTAWPDRVVLGFSDFVVAHKSRDILYDLLDANRPIIKLLASIFSSSESLTEALLNQPDLFDRLIIADPVGKTLDGGDYAKEFTQVTNGTGSTEKIMMGINSYRAYESLRLGLRLILGLSNRFELMIGLTTLAEQYLIALINIAKSHLESAGLEQPVGKWAVVAAGKVGRRETNYGSDLDLIVFYENTDESYESSRYVTKLVQETIRLSSQFTPHGPGYHIDMRLRPEGDAGPLVTSYSFAEAYYNSRAKAWERLALVGARTIAGDEKFCSKVSKLLSRFISNKKLKTLELKEFLDIRKRIAIEKIKPGTTDIKFSPGGLIEIEFICQALAIEHPEALIQKEPFTISMLKTSKIKKWLKEKDMKELEKAYSIYRSLEDTLRMNREQAQDIIPIKNTLLLRKLSHSVARIDVTPNNLIGFVNDLMRQVEIVYNRFFHNLINERR